MKRSVLITGGASGIGRATAIRLAGEGFHVVIADIDDAAAAAVAKDVDGSWLHLDVTGPANWATVVAQLDERGVALDGLVLNAGIAGGPTDLADLDLALTRRMFAINVDGVLLGLDALLPALLRTGGVAVAIASLAGVIGLEVDPIYTMTKHAVVGMVRSAAPGLRDRGVQLTAICPGLVDTPLLGPAYAILTDAGFPLLRPEDVAAAIADALTRRRTDEVIVLQPGRDPIAYKFAGIPGPKFPDGRPVPPLPTDLGFR